MEPTAHVLTAEQLAAHFLLTPEEFRPQLSKNAAGADAIRMNSIGKVERADDAEHVIVSYISTPSIDYVHDVMNPFGMDAKPLSLNRGVFYNHQWSGSKDLPIGKNTRLDPKKTGVIAWTKYAVDENPFAADIYRLVKGGFLNSYSIGFFPKEMSFVSLSDLRKLITGRFEVDNINEFQDDMQVLLFEKWVLYEYSQVGVPMNMNAVQKEALQKAMQTEGVILTDSGKTLSFHC